MTPAFSHAPSARTYLLALAACFLMLNAQGRSQEPAQTKSKPKPAKVQAKPGVKAPQDDDDSPTEIQIISLKSANAADVSELLKVMLGMKTPEGEEAGGRYVPIAVDQRTNSLIVSAPAEQIEWIRNMIKRLDVVSDNEPPAQRPVVVPLRFLEPDKALEESLRLLFPPSGFGPGQGNFTVDRQRKAVILWGDQKTTKAATELLETLEKQSANQGVRSGSNPDVQVRVVWLVNEVGRQEASKLPDDLKEVLPGLAKLGIDRPRLAAQTLVNVTPGSKFQTRGVAKLDSPCQFSVNGQFTGSNESGKLHIDIRASRLPQAGPGEICSLQTEISAPLGHLTVLGMTPTEAAASVFVVQVLVK